MKAFVGLFAGENISNCSLLATSANRHIIRTVASLLSGETLPPSEKTPSPLRKLREAKGYRLLDCERLTLGVLKQRHLGAIERGERDATPTEAGALQDLFGVPVEELGITVRKENG